MKKLIFIYGIIGALISTAWWSIGTHLLPKGASQDAQLWLGYASMIVAFAFIFVAVKRYRDNFGDGRITFGKALKIGLLVTLVASTIYVIAWMISYYFFTPDFFEKYINTMKLQMQAEGKSAEAISKAVAEAVKYREIYRNPVFNILLTYREIVPVGIVISLIAALILKKNPKTEPVNA